MPKYCGRRAYTTLGKSPATKLTAEQQITKKRLDAINPMLWQHLDAASKGKMVTHGLGPRPSLRY